MCFQMTFAIITPALICGAFADRMKFSAMMWFMGLWSLFVYSPIAHWVWGPDGFLAGSNDEFALCYYDEGDLGFIHPAGREFTVYDRFHCSLMGPTWPNRYYNWSAQSGGKRDNTPPADTLGNQWETVFDRAIARAGLVGRTSDVGRPCGKIQGLRQRRIASITN